MDTKLYNININIKPEGGGDTPRIMLRIVNTKPINGSPNIREGSPFKLTKETTISLYTLLNIHNYTIKSKIKAYVALDVKR